MGISFFGTNSQGGEGLKKNLHIIESLIFVLPFLVVSYLFYEQNFLFRSNELVVVTLIFILVLGGFVFLRRIFDRIIVLANSIRQAESGEMIQDDVRDATLQLEDLSMSFSRIMERLEKTTENLDQKVLELMAIKELYEVARKSIDIEAILGITLEKAMSVTRSQIGSIVVFDNDADQYRISLSRGLGKKVSDSGYINLDDSFLKHVIAEKEAIIIRDIEHDPRTLKPNDPRYGAPSLMSMPIMIENRVAAILNLTNKVTGESFGEKDKQIVAIMLDEISFALENAHLHARIKEHLKEIQEQNMTLELMVEKRTAELVDANESLRVEIAERKLAEKILQESEEKYRIHFSNVSDVIYSISPDFTFMNVSPSVESLLGYKPEEIIGMSISTSNIVAQECRDRVITDLICIMEGESPGPAVYEFVAKDGTKKIVEVNGNVLIQEEKVVAIISVARDISERQRLESELLHARKLEAIGTLAGGIAHDFNNVLTGIQGHASLMLFNINDGHPHFKNLKSIEEQVRSGSALTRQLLSLARGGKMEVEPTNISEIIRKTASIFGRTRKDIGFHESYQDDLWTVEVDRGQIEQVFLNLFINAAQAMPKGGEIRLATENITYDRKLTTAPYITPGKYVVLTVTDTGIGMDEKTREQIFEPFFTTKEDGKGTGLGLSSVYHIIKGHGGFINVHSEKGQGATFLIYLPVSDRKLGQVKLTSEKLCRGSETILLVDDEETVTSVCSNMLEMLGYRVMVARSGEEAVAMYQANHQEIDIVIMDMIMPGLGGEQALDRLKAINPDIRVIMSTGYIGGGADGKDPQIAARGSRDLLYKPYRLQVLSQKVREVIDESVNTQPPVTKTLH